MVLLDAERYDPVSLGNLGGMVPEGDSMTLLSALALPDPTFSETSRFRERA